MIQLVFSEPAENDLAEIAAFIAADDPAAALRVLTAIRAATAHLAAFPAIGRLGRVPGTREFTVTSLPYLIVYERMGDTLIIDAVLHGARDLPRTMAPRRAAIGRKQPRAKPKEPT